MSVPAKAGPLASRLPKHRGRMPQGSRKAGQQYTRTSALAHGAALCGCVGAVPTEHAVTVDEHERSIPATSTRHKATARIEDELGGKPTSALLQVVSTSRQHEWCRHPHARSEFSRQHLSRTCRRSSSASTLRRSSESESVLK